MLWWHVYLRHYDSGFVYDLGSFDLFMRGTVEVIYNILSLIILITAVWKDFETNSTYHLLTYSHDWYKGNSVR